MPREITARERYITLKRNMEAQLLVITLQELRDKVEKLNDDHIKNFIKIWYGKYPVEDPLIQMTQDEVLMAIDLVDRTLSQYPVSNNTPMESEVQ